MNDSSINLSRYILSFVASMSALIVSATPAFAGNGMHSLIGTVINTSGQNIPPALPGNFENVNLDAPFTINCPNAAGCTITVDINTSTQNATHQFNGVAFYTLIDGQYTAFSGRGYTLLDTDGDSILGSASDSMHVTKGMHTVVSGAYSTVGAQVWTYQCVYRLYKP